MWTILSISPAFPKLKERMAIEKNQIQLYCNQMFVTDHVENIVPEFLTLLHGVIDSPDIPLNVSRSYLQSDENVKKISTYITRKVADRLDEIFRNEREAWEKKWDNLKLFIEYGMLSDEKFCERAMKFALLKNTDGKYFSFEDYRKAVADQQTDKDKKVVYLYATNTSRRPRPRATMSCSWTVSLIRTLSTFSSRNSPTPDSRVWIPILPRTSYRRMTESVWR